MEGELITRDNASSDIGGEDTKTYGSLIDDIIRTLVGIVDDFDSGAFS